MKIRNIQKKTLKFKNLDGCEILNLKKLSRPCKNLLFPNFASLATGVFDEDFLEKSKSATKLQNAIAFPFLASFTMLCVYVCIHFCFTLRTLTVSSNFLRSTCVKGVKWSWIFIRSRSRTSILTTRNSWIISLSYYALDFWYFWPTSNQNLLAAFNFQTKPSFKWFHR